MDLDRWAALQDLARRQHGVVCREDLRRLGVSDDQVDRLLGTVLEPVHHGVSRLRSVAETPHARATAAVMAVAGPLVSAGERAVLAGSAAAAVWRLPVPQAASCVPLVVMTTRRCRPADQTVRAVQVAVLPRSVAVDGLLATMLARSAADVVRALPARAGDLFVDEVLQSGRLRLGALREELLTGSGRRGNPRLAQALARADPAAQGAAERLLHAGLRRRELFHLGEPQVPVRDREGLIGVGDWVRHRLRLVVECQGYAFHSRPDRFRSDIRRRNRLRRLGLDLLEVAAVDLWHRQEALLDEVEADLRARAAARGVELAASGAGTGAEV